MVSFKDIKKQAACSVSRSHNITVLPMVNATGHHLKTLVIFKGKRLNIGDLINIPEDIFVTSSENGWVDSEIKCEWIKHVAEQIDTSKR